MAIISPNPVRSVMIHSGLGLIIYYNGAKHLQRHTDKRLSIYILNSDEI